MTEDLFHIFCSGEQTMKISYKIVGPGAQITAYEISREKFEELKSIDEQLDRIEFLEANAVREKTLACAPFIDDESTKIFLHKERQIEEVERIAYWDVDSLNEEELSTKILSEGDNSIDAEEIDQNQDSFWWDGNTEKLESMQTVGSVFFKFEEIPDGNLIIIEYDIFDEGSVEVEIDVLPNFQNIQLNLITVDLDMPDPVSTMCYQGLEDSELTAFGLEYSGAIYTFAETLSFPSASRNFKVFDVEDGLLTENYDSIWLFN